jgi:hypothetical protein
MRHANSMPEPFDYVLLVFTPFSEMTIVESVCKPCMIKIGDKELVAV